MDRSPGFGSAPSNLIALFRLAFAAAPPVAWLNLATESNSLAHSSIGTPSPVQDELRLLVGTRFQGLFHSPPGVLFTFPSRYWFTIGHHGYLALDRGRPGFPRDFSCPVVLTDIGGRHLSFHIRDCHPLRWPVPGSFCYDGALSLPADPAGSAAVPYNPADA
jgi:hypothetical protein